MVKKPLRKFMENNPYWGVFDWHPLNLILKRPKRKSERESIKTVGALKKQYTNFDRLSNLSQLPETT